MTEIMENVNAIIDKYSEQLAHSGIKITASKRYFEDAVPDRICDADMIDRDIDRRREEKKGYDYQRNRYHCIVLTVSPTQKDIVRREACREYAFVLKKIEREHIGIAPKKTMYEEQKLLTKIENRIVRILRKAQKSNPIQICKDTFYDALRYTATKYGYKRRFLNKHRADWEIIFLSASAVLVLAVVLIIWLIGKLF